MKFISLCLSAAVILSPGNAAMAQSGSAAAGAATFRLNCGPCHSGIAGRNAIGPSLAGVAGREAAQFPNYAYSPAMKQSGLIWTDADIDEFLTSPSAKVPGTKMTFAGIAASDQRADLIAFLKAFQPAGN